ncbi:MAG: hypothetical protein AB7P03_09420 [Kofleriaceae bacterium]
MIDAIARALAAACDDRDVLRRIGGGLGIAAVAAFDELTATSPGARAPLKASWASAARAPVPPGLRAIDPSWVEAALAALPSRARAAVAAPGGPVAVWFARWACASLPAMPAIDAAIEWPASPEQVVQMPASSLRAWLDAVGEDQLVHAVGAAGASAVAATGHRVGRDLRDAARRIREPPRAGELGPVRSAIQRCRVELDARALVRIAARAIAPRFDPLRARQLAARLPYPIGSVVLVELDLHAADPMVEAPTWRALAAAC